MFLNHKILRKLLKDAYKREKLSLACETGKLYIAAGYWEMEFLKEYIPNETLGDIISFSRTLPEDGQRYQILDSGNQLEIGLPRQIEECKNAHPTEVTNWLNVSDTGRILRVLQDASGETRLVDDICVKMVDGNYCERTKGEEAPTSPTYDEHFVMWKNNIGKFRVLLHLDEEKEETLKQLGMIDLRRNSD